MASPSPKISVDCVIDRDILNAETYPKLENAGLSIFAPLCGRNRGYVLRLLRQAAEYRFVVVGHLSLSFFVVFLAHVARPLFS